MLPRHQPDRIRIAFDDHRLVANAGLILPSTLALRLGLPQLVDRHLDLGHATGRANTGDKMMTLVASALAGGDCINDADALRAGGTAWRRAKPPAAPSMRPGSCPTGGRSTFPCGSMAWRATPSRRRGAGTSSILRLASGTSSLTRGGTTGLRPRPRRGMRRRASPRSSRNASTAGPISSRF